MKILMQAAVVLALFAGAASATYYDIGKNGENKINVSWESRASLETIVGRTNQATGFVYFAETGPAHMIQITIPVASMKTGIAMRDEHMASAGWLDAANYPNIEFRSVSIKRAASGADRYDITGDMTIHGQTKRITVSGTAKRFPAKPELEKMGYVGEIIHLQTTFPLKLSDYGVKIPENMLGLKMADEIQINFDLFAVTNNDPNRKPPAPVAKPAATPAAR